MGPCSWLHVAGTAAALQGSEQGVFFQPGWDLLHTPGPTCDCSALYGVPGGNKVCARAEVWHRGSCCSHGLCTSNSSGGPGISRREVPQTLGAWERVRSKLLELGLC